MEHKSRPRGSGGYRHTDEPLLQEMASLLERREVPSVEAAARAVADRAHPIASKSELSLQSKARRLARRYREFFSGVLPRRNCGESDSMSGMDTQFADATRDQLRRTIADLLREVEHQANRADTAIAALDVVQEALEKSNRMVERRLDRIEALDRALGQQQPRSPAKH